MADNRIRNRKKPSHDEAAHETVSTMTNHEVRNSIIGFNYDDLNISDDDKTALISFEKELAFQGKQLGNVSYIIGENLHKAKLVFKKYADRNLEGSDPETFVNWYIKLGLTKDQTYLFLGRYNLALCFPEYKDKIIALSDRIIKETINKKTPEEVTKQVLEGKISTGKEVKEARALVINQISSTLEISEAEIIEEPIDYISVFEKDLKEFNQCSREFNSKLKEKIKELPTDKQKTLVSKMEFLTKEMKKLMKSI